MQKQVNLTVEENEQYLQEVEFLKKAKEEEKNRFSVCKNINQFIVIVQQEMSLKEDEIKRLKTEIELLNAEKEYLSQSAGKVELLKQRIEQLVRIEKEYEELKKEVVQSEIW